MVDLVEVDGFQYKRTTAARLGLIESKPGAASAEAGPAHDKLIRSAPQTGAPVQQEPNPEPAPVTPDPASTGDGSGQAEPNPEQPAAQPGEAAPASEVVTAEPKAEPAKKTTTAKGK